MGGELASLVPRLQRSTRAHTHTRARAPTHAHTRTHTHTDTRAHTSTHRHLVLLVIKGALSAYGTCFAVSNERVGIRIDANKEQRAGDQLQTLFRSNEPENAIPTRVVCRHPVAMRVERKKDDQRE